MTLPPSPSSRHAPITEVLTEILLIALLAFMPAAFGVVEPWSEAVAFATGAAIALCLALRAITSSDNHLRPSLAWVAVALFILIVAAQLLPLPMSLLRTISPQTAALKTQLLGDLPDASEVLARETISFFPLGTRHELRTVLVASIVFAAVVTVYRDDRRIRRLLAAVALIGGAFAVLALGQDITHSGKIYWSVVVRGGPAQSGPFFNHSHYGQFMNLSVGCALALLLARLTEAPRISFAALARRTWWLAAIIIIGLATVSLSLTRGGTISILASAAVATIVLLASRNLRQMAGVMVLLLLATLAFLFYHGFESVYARMIETGLEGRLQMMRDTVAMSRKFPVTGVGLGAFEWIFPMFDRSFVPSTAEYVENEYLQALSDTGPLGLAAVILFVGVIATRYFRAIRNHEDERIGLAAAGLGYGLVAVMVHSLTDFGQHLPAIACLSAVTCGLLFNLGHRRQGGRTIRVGRAFGVIALVLVVAISAWGLIGVTRTWQAAGHWTRVRQMARALEAKNWKGSDADFSALLDAANAAITAAPDNANHRYWAAVYRWRWVRTQADAKTGNTPVNEQTVAAAQRIIGELNEARTRAPTYGLVYTILGQIELNFLQRPIGYEHIQTGHMLSRNDAYAAFVAGEAETRRGNFEKAQANFREALLIDPWMVDDVIEVYLTDLNRPELAGDAVGDDFMRQTHLRDALRKQEQWKSLADQAEERGFAALEAETKRPDAKAWKFAMVGTNHEAHQRYAEAERFYARALQAEPTNLDWRCRRAEMLRKLGRTREALEEARLALQQHPDSPQAKQMLSLITGQPQ